MGNTPNLLSLQVEDLHLPSRLVPKAGSLLPASVPHMSWQKPSNTFMASAPYLCIGISFSGVWGDEKEQGSLSWSELHDNTRHENQTRSRWGLLVKFPSCFPFHALCFVSLILWPHGSHGIGSQATPQKKANQACGVPDWARPRKRWKYPDQQGFERCVGLLARSLCKVYVYYFTHLSATLILRVNLSFFRAIK